MTDEVQEGATPIDGEAPEEVQQSASQLRLLKYKSFVVKPEQIDELWEAEDPCAKA